jgi:hypothetical protein
VEDLIGKQFKRYAFVSCAGSECLLWDYSSKSLQSESAGNADIEEVLQPAKILDSETMHNILHVQAFQVMEGAYLVSALGDQR